MKSLAYSQNENWTKNIRYQPTPQLYSLGGSHMFRRELWLQGAQGGVVWSSGESAFYEMRREKVRPRLSADMTIKRTKYLRGGVGSTHNQRGVSCVHEPV